MLLGPEHDQERIDVGPGDFVCLPKGEIHGTIIVDSTGCGSFYLQYAIQPGHSSAYAGDHGLGRGGMRNSGGKLS
jgi:hypothetical protein